MTSWKKSCALAGVLAGLAPLASAQVAESGTLDEVIVTAQRVEENLQKAAAAITALDGQALIDAGISQPGDLNKLVPGLGIGAGGPSTQVYLRGVGNYGTNGFADPAVAFNVDGVSDLLTAVDRGTWSKTDPINDVAGTSYYLVPTSPFGRSVRLELDGYLPSTFTVYPITGKRVDPARDFTRWPSLLLRLPPTLFPMLGGEKPLVLLKLSQTARGKEGRALWCAPVDHKAVLLGPSRAIDPALVAGWREEVIARGLSEAQRAQVMIGWRQHEAHRLDNPVAPGTALRADAINLNTRCIMATATFALGAEGLHDQPMELSPTYAEPSCTDGPAVRCPGDAPAGPDGR